MACPFLLAMLLTSPRSLGSEKGKWTSIGFERQYKLAIDDRRTVRAAPKFREHVVMVSARPRGSPQQCGVDSVCPLRTPPSRRQCQRRSGTC